MFKRYNAWVIRHSKKSGFTPRFIKFMVVAEIIAVLVIIFLMYYIVWVL